MSSIQVGFIIEGVVKEDKSVLFCTSDDEKYGLAWCSQVALPVPSVLPRVGSVDTTIEPFRVREQYASYALRLAATEETGSILFERATRAQATLTEYMTPSQGYIKLSESGLADDADFTPVYIDAETILLPKGSEDGNTGKYTNVIRAAGRSKGRRHFEGVNVYTNIPYWIGRKVWLFTYRAGEPVQISTQRDILSIKSSFVQDKGTIKVQLDSILSGLDSISVNQNPAVVSGETVKFDVVESGDDKGDIKSQKITGNLGFEGISKVDKAPSNMFNAVWAQIGKAIRPVGQEGKNILDFRDALTPPPRNEQGDIDDFDETNIHELLVIAPDADIAFNQYSSTYRFYDYRDEGFLYMYHPLVICASLMMSTQDPGYDLSEFDIFHHNFSLQLRDSFAPGAPLQIRELVEDTKQLQIDQLVLGYNGEPLRIMDTIREILNTYGFRLSYNNFGYLQFSKIALPTADDVAKYSGTPLNVLASDLLEQDTGAGDISSVVRGTVGKTPWSNGRAFSIQSEDRFGNVPPIQQKESDELGVKAETILKENLGSLRTLLEARALIQSQQLARVKVQVEDWQVKGLDYGLGSFIQLGELGLATPWLWTADGERVRADGSWFGQIIGRRYLPLKNVYELEIIFTSTSITLWRTPSEYGQRYGSTKTFQVSTSNGVHEGVIKFKEGNQVVFVHPDGTQNGSSIYTIESIDNTTKRIKFESSIPADESYIELAHLRTSGPEGFYNPEELDLMYVFLANLNNELGDEPIDGSYYGG